MNENLIKLIENAKVSVERIEKQIIHPVLHTQLEPRNNYLMLQKASENFFKKGIEPRMFGLSGLRGTGKTTLLWQTAQYIYNNITQNIYFINVNSLIEYNTTIRDFLEVLQTDFLKMRFVDYTEPIVLLFDEVHEDKKWTNTLKILYDELRIGFFVATGSSALLLQTSADLASRMIIEHIFPLSFTEYLFIRNIVKRQDITVMQNDLINILFYSENIKNVEIGLNKYQKALNTFLEPIENIDGQIQQYIEYYNITRFCIFNEPEFIQKAITELYKRIIHEDIPIIAGEKSTYLHAEKLLRRLAASDEINIQTLSQALGISQNEINETLEILTKAELLNVLYAHGGIDSKLNKMQKYFFMSPSVRKILLSPLTGMKTSTDLSSKLFEDTVVMYLKRIFNMESVVTFSSKLKQKNPDFIIETHEKPILCEIGTKKQHNKQITQSHIDYRYGIVLSSDIDCYRITTDTVFIPFKWFLLV